MMLSNFPPLSPMGSSSYLWHFYVVFWFLMVGGVSIYVDFLMNDRCKTTTTHHKQTCSIDFLMIERVATAKY